MQELTPIYIYDCLPIFAFNGFDFVLQQCSDVMVVSFTDTPMSVLGLPLTHRIGVPARRR